ncbi:uncharacterized protein PHALS_15324 [Plasmopara halstedii]|uniref:Uncharacterized protein n=1 Tax=Plasmopara halstedii TaxID=4781 RepID=A0A0P1ADT6_PLAHL|nr:uncharacterized protein PHALS_15324 [Plasmopara halstedii]CEG38590.1 hypothetical protein PHALS_15324 [Plasmopara halstedii]|eukprot:XP_024574959.1 hypothetical protein PHALS_15324 [Plasmopara halstedii]
MVSSTVLFFASFRQFSVLTDTVFFSDLRHRVTQFAEIFGGCRNKTNKAEQSIGKPILHESLSYFGLSIEL